MSDWLIDTLARRAPRERALLALLTLLILPGGLWFGVLLPLHDRRQTAVAELYETRALHDWVLEKSAEMAGFDATGNTGPQPAVGLSALEQSLISVDLRAAVSGLANRANGGIDLRFDAVEFGALMGWLGAQDPGWGYDIITFRFERGEEPGMVSAELRLDPQG